MVYLKIFILRFMSLTMVSQVIQWFHKKKNGKIGKSSLDLENVKIWKLEG